MDSSLLVWYPLNEGTGNSVHNKASSSYNSSAAVCGWDTGIGDGLCFEGDGASTYIRANDAAAFDVTAITIAAWVKSDAVPVGWGLLAARGCFGVEDPFVLGTLADGIGLYTKLVTSGGGVSGNWGVSLTAGAVQHVAITYNSVAGLIEYLDGAPVHSRAANGTLAAGAQSLRVAGVLSSNWFKGLMKDVRFYNRALSGAEIGRLYRGTLDNRVSVPALCKKFCQEKW